MELDSRNKSRRDRMMRSKSFDTQEMREIDRKEAAESRGFPILWMGITDQILRIRTFASSNHSGKTNASSALVEI